MMLSLCKIHNTHQFVIRQYEGRLRNAAIFNYFFQRKFAGEIQSFVIEKTFIY